MVAYIGSPHYTHRDEDCVGVLITNLGTPDAPTVPAVRRFLREFLWDPRVIEVPRFLWWFILHGVILRFRPRRTTALYRTVWSEAGSPLLDISRRQQRALQASLAPRALGPEALSAQPLGAAVKVALGMRYGSPSVDTALAELRDAGARRILVLPLYPQYSATTTASTFDALAEALAKWRWLPELRFIPHYHDHPAHIEALVHSVRDAWAEQEHPGEHLLFSFHGLPERYLKAGDPYFCECQKTARLVAEALALPAERWAVSFQSRVGREPWLRPYTDELLLEWAKGDVGSVSVICPGFSADCLETLEEIAIQNRERFLEAGGHSFRYIPALNDHPRHIEALARLVREHTAGWDLAPGTGAPARAERQRRAVALGASH